MQTLIYFFLLSVCFFFFFGGGGGGGEGGEGPEASLVSTSKIFTDYLHIYRIIHTFFSIHSKATFTGSLLYLLDHALYSFWEV